jgi:hypothetical protein
MDNAADDRRQRSKASLSSLMPGFEALSAGGGASDDDEIESELADADFQDETTMLLGAESALLDQIEALHRKLHSVRKRSGSDSGPPTDGEVPMGQDERIMAPGSKLIVCAVRKPMRIETREPRSTPDLKTEQQKTSHGYTCVPVLLRSPCLSHPPPPLSPAAAQVRL